MDAPFVPIGRIVKAHGLRGEVSVKALTDLPLDAFVDTTTWATPPTSSFRTGRIMAVRPGPKGALVTLEGVSDIATASALVGTTLIARRGDVPEAALVERFDPVGMEVVDESRGTLGSVSDVIETGANDVWVVSGGTYGEVLIPVIDDVVLDIDEAGNVISIRLLAGLIDEDD